jgi:hypothetical protein
MPFHLAYVARWSIFMIDIDSLNLRRSDRYRDIAIAGSERDVCLVRNAQDRSISGKVAVAKRLDCA